MRSVMHKAFIESEPRPKNQARTAGMIGAKAYLNLLREVFLTQFKLKDQSTLLGYVWSFLHPLVMLGILFYVFHNRIGKDIQQYPIYLLIGIVQYTHFSNSTMVALRVLRSMRGLTCNTIFPKEILVLGSVLSASIEFVFSYCICVLLSVFLAGVSPAILLLPGVVLLQLMLAFGVALFLSCCYVFVKDIDHIYQLLLRMLFFVTPIFYDISFLGASKAKYLVAINPLTLLVNFSRKVLIDGELFSIKIFFLFFLLNCVLVGLGLLTFRKYEPEFAQHM